MSTSVTASEGASRSPTGGRTLFNVLSNWGGQLFALVVSFFLTPYIVHRLGNSAYGVWTLIASMTTYMALMDLGVRGAITRYVSKFSAQDDHDSAARTVSTALRIFVITGGTVVLLSVALALLLVGRLQIPADQQFAARIVMVLAGLNVGVTLVTGVYTGILAGKHRFDLLNLGDVSISVARVVAVVTALATGHGIVALAAIQLVLSLTRGLLFARLSRQVYPALRIRMGLAEWQYVRLIFSFSSFSFLIHVSGSLIYYTDAAVIAAFLPIAALTFFAIGSSLVEYARMLVSSVSQTMSPLASSLDASGQRSRLQALLLDSARFSMMLVLPIAVTFMIRGESFIRLWMGPEYAAISGGVLLVLTLPLFLHAGGQATGGIFLGISKHKPIVPAMLAEGLINLALSIFLVRRMGLIGVAWGTAIPAVLSNLLFWPWYIQRTLGIEPLRYFSAIWGRPFLGIVPFAICSLVVERVWPAETLVTFMAQVALCTVVAAAGFWQICLARTQRQEIVDAARRMFFGLTVQESTN